MENRACFRWLFEELDRDQDGFLNPYDLISSLSHYGYHPSRDYVSKIFAKYNTSESGQLTFQEFLTLSQQNSQSSSSPTNLLYAFQDIDLSHQGFLDRQILKSFASSHGETLTEQELNFFFSTFNHNQPHLTLQQFIQFNSSPPP